MVDRPFPENLVSDGDGPDRALTEAEEKLAASLGEDDLAAIDEALLERASERYRKVAALVANAFSKMETRLPHLPDVFYGRRVRQLVEMGVLESQGNLDRMRFSEVRFRTRGRDGSGV